MTDAEILDISLYLELARANATGTFVVATPNFQCVLDRAEALLAEVRSHRDAIGLWRQANIDLSDRCCDVLKQLQEEKGASDTYRVAMNEYAGMAAELREQLQEEKAKSAALEGELAQSESRVDYWKRSLAESESRVDAFRAKVAGDVAAVNEAKSLKVLLADEKQKVALLGQLDRDHLIDIEGLKQMVGRKEEALTAYRNSDWELRGEVERLKAEVERMAVENGNLKHRAYKSECYGEFLADAVPRDREKVSEDLDYAIGSLLDRDSSPVDRIANALAILVRAQCGLDGAGAD